MGDFSLAKTIRIIEDKVSDDVTEEAFKYDIMPSAGDEMSAGGPKTIINMLIQFMDYTY